MPVTSTDLMKQYYVSPSSDTCQCYLLELLICQSRLSGMFQTKESLCKTSNLWGVYSYKKTAPVQTLFRIIGRLLKHEDQIKRTLSVWCSIAKIAATCSCKETTSKNCPQSAMSREQSWARFIFTNSASSSGDSAFF